MEIKNNHPAPGDPAQTKHRSQSSHTTLPIMEESHSLRCSLSCALCWTEVTQLCISVTAGLRPISQNRTILMRSKVPCAVSLLSDPQTRQNPSSFPIRNE